MKLFFAGTRGGIEARTERHFRHTSLVVIQGRKRILIDCGEDWRGRMNELCPDAIVLTHAHLDHAWGLNAGAPCDVFATAETWKCIGGYPITQRQIIKPRLPFDIFGVIFEAFVVEHSVRCPCVGFRVVTQETAIFYCPDVVYIHERQDALSGAVLFIGDGASISKPCIYKRGEALVGHAPIGHQLGWCQNERVPNAIFTHCGLEIVTGNETELQREVQKKGAAVGVGADLAFDGLEIQV